MNSGIIQAGSAFVPAPARGDRGQNETMALVLAAQRQAEIQARYLLAKQNPRDLDVVREKLLKECRRPSFADVARYRKPIGKGVEGLSIRFAEAALRLMKNITIQQTVVSEDEFTRKILVEVADVGELVSYSKTVSIEKTVERNSVRDGDVIVRQRTGSRGQQVYIIQGTEDDLLNKENALISKAIRTEGLRLVPGDLLDECERTILETIRRADAEDPDAAKRKIFDSFATVGVTVDQLKLYLGHDGSTLTPKELQDLRAIYAAIRDGETTWKATIEPVLAERRKAEAAKDDKGSTSGSTKGMGAVARAVAARTKGNAPEPPAEDPTTITTGDVAAATGSEESK
jgi:hypothetical protein